MVRFEVVGRKVKAMQYKVYKVSVIKQTLRGFGVEL